jgi:hypothetical protein
MKNITPDQMILVALINGLTDRALGMAQVVALTSDDANGNSVIERIRGEAFERMLAADAADIDEGPTLDELTADVPAEVRAVIGDDDMGPDDRLQMQRDMEDTAAAWAEAEAAEDNDEALLSDPVPPAKAAAPVEDDEELLF